MTLQKNLISPARKISLELLNDILKSNKPFEQIISSSEKFNNLEIKNKKFCRLIITTVLRKFGQIDFVLDKFTKKGSIKQNIFKNIIRIGIAEILFIKSAKYAAINEAVELTKLKVSKNLSKLTNGVLRNIDRENEELIIQLSDELSYPSWLVQGWRDSWGEKNTKDARLTSFNNSKDRFDEGIIDSFNYLQIKQSYDTSVSDEIRSKYDYIFKLKVLEFYFGIPISM